MNAYLKAAVAAFLIAALPAIAAEPKEANPIATLVVSQQGTYGDENIEPKNLPLVKFWNKGQLVIRSAEELVALSSTPDKAKDQSVQEESTRQLAELLKVNGIDWNKQMVVGLRLKLSGGNPSMSIRQTTLQDNQLTVQYVNSWGRCGVRDFFALAIVDRFDGEVKFAFLEPKK
jgi:hypothetical protein